MKLRNINQLSLNREFVNIKETRSNFSCKYLPMTIYIVNWNTSTGILKGKQHRTNTTRKNIKKKIKARLLIMYFSVTVI